MACNALGVLVLSGAVFSGQVAAQETAQASREQVEAAHRDAVQTARDWKAASASLPDSNSQPDVLAPLDPARLPATSLYNPRDDAALLGSGSAADGSDAYRVMREGDAARGTIAPAELSGIKARGEAIHADPQGFAAGISADGTQGSCQELESSSPLEVFHETSCNTGTKLIPRTESCAVPLDVSITVRTFYRYIAGQDSASATSGPFADYAGFADELASGKCRQIAAASWCANLARVGVAVPADCAANTALKAYELRCEGEAAGITPTGSGYAGQRDVTTGQLWFAREEELAGVNAARNMGMCAPLTGNPDCIFEAETCTSSDPVTRMVGGFPVTQPCWAWQRRYTCYTRVQTSDCAALAADTRCQFVRRECLDDQASGPCQVQSDIYRCRVPGGAAQTTREQVCGGDVYCLNGSCQEIEREASDELKDALIALGAMDQAEKEFDPANLSLFKGLRETCHKPVFGLIDCCAGKSSGLLSTASGAAALAGGPVAIAALATPLLTVFLCSSAEKMLDVKDRMGLCTRLGTYCSARILGICSVRRTAYCCFESKLTRILQEQGRAQLAKPWGSPRTEQCAGFTVAEFSRLDLSRMDFTEVYEEFLEAAKLPDEVEMAAQIQQKIRDYYASHAAAPAP